MNNRKKIIISVFLLILLSFSGCLDFFQDIATTNITYEKHPTKIQYHISYGYQLNFDGYGSSTVNYREDLPEALNTPGKSTKAIMEKLLRVLK